jgi:hypothetical protein
MEYETINSGYGQAEAGAFPMRTGKLFFVSESAGIQTNVLKSKYKTDRVGVNRVYANFTDALAACVAGRGDVIVVAPDVATAMTATEVLAAETKGVQIARTGARNNGTLFAYRAAAALPQGVQAPLFTVTGRVKLVAILGIVTTVIQTQANNTKLVANPTTLADVDICAVLNITAFAVGTQLGITGTLATAMQSQASAVMPYQAAPVILPAGTLDLSCAASNTGAIKWLALYEPVDPGAMMIPA